jgi:hypothetical protein
MKLPILIIFFFLSYQASAQLLSGDLVDENRKLETATDFTLKDSNKGFVVCELAVERSGKVTSIAFDLAATTVVSIPSKIKVRNYLNTFVFEKGNHFPAFHHVKVKITLVD